MSNNFTFMSVSEVCNLLNVCRTTLWKLSKTNPNFPNPIQITAKRKAYRKADIERFINDDNNLCKSDL